jgi:hypothetical protein
VARQTQFLLTRPWAQVGKCACDSDDIPLIRACANPIDIVVATSAMTNRFNMFRSLFWLFCHAQFLAHQARSEACADDHRVDDA